MKRPLQNSLLALVCALFLFAPGRVHAEPKASDLAAAGVGAFAVGYLNQATIAFSLRGDLPRGAFIPILGPVRLITDAIRTDCSGAFEWNCGIGAMIFFGSLQLGLEGAGLGLLAAAGVQHTVRISRASQPLSMPLLQFSF